MAKIVWIVGASSGIGRALALEMVRDGWTVVASARRQEQLDELAAEGPDGKIKVYTVDATDADACKQTAAAIEAEQGPIDCAVFAAGTHIPQTLEDIKVEDYRTLIDLNIGGVVNGVAAVLPGFKARKAGHLVVVSSVAGYRGLPQASGYGATKAALINLTESLKFDLDHIGVKTQVVCPGFVRTPLTDKNPFPMPFLMEVEDAARAMYRGMKTDAFEVIFPKRLAYILKFLGLLPDWLYFKLVHKGTGL
jgi:NADP-dependent 3-hydroxy acid dehydrogenase YdfG